VIENFHALKAALQAEGCVFRSDTDTEVIAHLVAAALVRLPAAGRTDDPADSPCVAAVREAVSRLRGTYGLAVLFRGHDDLLVAARCGSPLVVGIGDGEHFVASDASALAGRTDRIVHLADHEVAAVGARSLRIVHRDSGRVVPAVQALHLSAADVDTGGHPHFMLKEIHEQPETIRPARPALAGRRHRRIWRLEPRSAAVAPREPPRAHRLRHELARGPGGRIPDRGVRPAAGRGGVRQ
jgi:glucosamine--fructose-6-phosphate aminotransferase (isomerizing)